MGQEKQSTRFVHSEGDQPTSTYATNFRLIVSNIPWDGQALMKQFRSSLRSDVKVLLLTFLENPKSLTDNKIVFLSINVSDNNK